MNFIRKDVTVQGISKSNICKIKSKYGFHHNIYPLSKLEQEESEVTFVSLYLSTLHILFAKPVAGYGLWQ